MNGSGKSNTKVIRHKNRNAVEQFNDALDREELCPMAKPTQTVASHLKTSLGSSLSYKFQKLPSRRKLVGVQSLKVLAAKFLAQNVDAIPRKVLTQFGWTHTKAIWDQIQEGLLDSLETFAKFAAAFPDDMNDKKTVHTSLVDLPRILSGLISLLQHHTEELHGPRRPLPWVLHLDLSQISVPIEMLLQLGTLPGLTVLKVNDSGITTSVVSHWSRSQAAGGFAALRLLDIRHNSSGFGDQSIILPKLFCFDTLQFIRCDRVSVDSLIGSSQDQERRLILWHSIMTDPRATIELRAHLGSQADRRPVTIATDDVIIDIHLARNSTSETAVALPQSRERLSVALLRRQKRQKRLAAQSGIGSLGL